MRLCACVTCDRGTHPTVAVGPAQHFDVGSERLFLLTQGRPACDAGTNVNLRMLLQGKSVYSHHQTWIGCRSMCCQCRQGRLETWKGRCPSDGRQLVSVSVHPIPGPVRARRAHSGPKPHGCPGHCMWLRNPECACTKRATEKQSAPI